MMLKGQVVLIAIMLFDRVAAMKAKNQDDPGVWNFREVPREAIVKAKIVAAVQGKSVKALLIDLVEACWLEMDKKGVLPKGK